MQIRDRGGSIELAVRPVDGASSADLVLRARVLDLDANEIRVETPMTLGMPVVFTPGLSLVAIIAIGQNRWRFDTSCLGFTPHRSDECAALRLAAPARVKRCQRRTDERMDASGLTMPCVDLWPLLEPNSVTPAQRLTAMNFKREVDGLDDGAASSIDGDLLPTLGPCVHGRLVNLGGGGLGVTVGVDASSIVMRHAIWWMQFSLEPMVRTPVCSAARMAHRHLRSDRSVYCGMCFDFAVNPGHRQTVSGQIRRAIAGLQRRQLAA